MTDQEIEQHATDRRKSVSDARLRAQASLTLLAGTLVLVILIALGLIVWQGIAIRDGQATIRTLVDAQAVSAKDVQAILDAQVIADSTRQNEIDTAVARIAADQKKALAAHDAAVKDYLQRALGLLDVEVNATANKERLPGSGVATPRPVPVVPTCVARGGSGTCKK